MKVRPDGTVKVLDFGLAKAADQGSGIGDQGPGGAANSPTITTPAMTMRGMILGTAAYMSPEQARGKVLDKRTDIWAFGAVLYEMLSGTRPFVGDDTTDVIAAVVKTTPDWSVLPADVPRPLVTLIQRCLEKDRKARVGDIAVARFLLTDSATFGTSTPTAASSGAPPRSVWSRGLPWSVAAALGAGLLVVLGLWAPWRAETPPNLPLVRLDVDLGADVSLPAPNGGRSNVAISPDGTRLAYVSGIPTKLFTRRLDQPKATELAGTQGASQPFFSPDGQWVGFFSGNKANKVSVEGGAVVAISENLSNAGGYRGGSRGEDGTIFVGPFGAEGRTGLQLLFSEQKGNAYSLMALSTADQRATPFGGVQSLQPVEAVCSPDGRWVAYSSTQVAGGTLSPDRGIFVQPFPATGAPYQVPKVRLDSIPHGHHLAARSSTFPRSTPSS